MANASCLTPLLMIVCILEELWRVVTDACFDGFILYKVCGCISKYQVGFVLFLILNVLSGF